MNEYERSFYDDLREKKRTATGARHLAPRGKKSFAVHLPSDYLTEKQRKELSGPVTTIKLKPVLYEEFRTFTDAEKKLYFNLLSEQFNVSIGMTAEMMLVSYNTILTQAKRVGFDSFARGGNNKRTAAAKQAIHKWMTEFPEYMARRKELCETKVFSALDPVSVPASTEPKEESPELETAEKITELSPILAGTDIESLVIETESFKLTINLRGGDKL